MAFHTTTPVAPVHAVRTVLMDIVDAEVAFFERLLEVTVAAPRYALGELGEPLLVTP